MKSILKHILLSVFLLVAATAFATHNRAGEITFQQTGPLTFKFTVTTYTDPSVVADRGCLVLYFGDGDSAEMVRMNGPVGPWSDCQQSGPLGEVVVPNKVKKNIYEATHTYPGPGTYAAFMSDPNRNEGIVNMPGSVNVVFFLQTTIRISASPITGGFNSSPILYNMPIDNACACKRFIHNPGAFDPDPQDSLSYVLGPCLRENGQIINSYYIPGGVTLDAVSGDLVWQCPGPQVGEYSFCILIISWRGGAPIDTVRRDMQVFVNGACNNDPPVVTASDLCVDAGDTLLVEIGFDDPNGHPVTATSTGFPYQLANSPAQFNQPQTGPVPFNNTFFWPTNCSHVRNQPYQVTFKGDDNPPDPFDHLADLKTIKITVVSPGPDSLKVEPSGNNMVLSWLTCPCTQAIGYKIFRKTGPSGFIPGPCQTGVPSFTGYQQIARLNGVSVNSFIDNNNGSGLVHGQQYCYMICAFFADSAESYASNEDCAVLVKDVPVITNVSIEATASDTGRVYVAWSKPDTSVMDLQAFPGPYYYRIFRSPGSFGQNFVLIDSTAVSPLLDDTTFVHAGINTKDNSNSYKIELFSLAPQRVKVGETQTAGSPYLSIQPSDNSLFLDWAAVVPWTNDSFVVYRQNFSTGLFDSIAFTTLPLYTDTGLANGRTYCYKIKTSGFYSQSGFADPLSNFSQEICGVPIDNVSPCPPDLSVQANCDSVNNFLSWNNPNLTCADDVLYYELFFTPRKNQPFTSVLLVSGASNVNATHNDNNVSIAGCYYITALDSVGNRSISSDTVCVDNCPVYSLPNIFTPNADGRNDFFRPFPYRFIESINLQVFNRWGNVVFETSDPEIMWNGKYMNGEKACSDGVYYYVCLVNEIRLEGVVSRKLTGFLHLMNSPNPNAD
jgi:gliding motility-associated-like protein